MTAKQNPEQKARDTIDALLAQAGWVVQSKKKLDLNAGPDIAVREYRTDIGPADYVLLVDRKACGVIEAKKEDLDDNRKFTELCTVQRLKNPFVAKDSQDIFWLKDKSLADLDNLPEPDELADEIIQNLEAGLERFRAVAEALQ